MITRKALKGAIASILLFPTKKFENADMESVMHHLAHRVKNHLMQMKAGMKPVFGLKFIVKLKVILQKFSDELEKVISLDVWFGSCAQTIFVSSKKAILQSVQMAFREILAHFDNYVHVGSGWALRKVVALELTVAKFKILRGGCFQAQLPKELENSKGVISLQHCPQGKCFAYAVAASITNVKKNPARSSQYMKLANLFKWKRKKQTCFTKFIKINEIPEFEKQFPFISVNVYGFEKTAYPLYVSPKKKRQIHVNLLFFENHYFPVRNLSSLVKLNNRKSGRAVKTCQNCLALFTSKERFQLHKQLCQDGKSMRIKLPEIDKAFMKFKNYSHMIPSPFVIYCDLESLVKEKEMKNEGKLISTRPHQAIAAGAITICHVDPSLSSKPFIYTGLDCIVHLLWWISSEMKRINELLLLHYHQMKLTAEDKIKIEQTTCCEMCRAPFNSERPKYRDHDHLTGKFRMVLCNTCNLNHAKPKMGVNIFFHGLSNYDSHFIIQELYKIKYQDLRIVPRTSEKYLSFKIDDAQFKDSFQFLGASLASLVENLVSKGLEHFHIVKSVIRNKEQQNLMFQKGVFPYSYMESLDVLNDTQLPSKEQFDSELTGEGISDTEYAFAKKVWSVFQCKTLRNYMEVYLLADVLLLADVFENFRRISIEEYSLDPVYYFSTPHMTLDAFLKFTNVTLDLIMDHNHYLFFKQSIRGGLSMVCRRYSKCNLPEVDGFNPLEKKKHICYFDANNLYGKCMMWPLPLANFEWMSENELTQEYIMGLEKEGDVGCIIQCDFEYPKEIHDEHLDFPLAPVHQKMTYKMLSPYAKQICDKFNLKHALNTKKLVTTLDDKEDYILHYWNFQLYLSLGLKVKRIIRGIKFKQKAFMKPYIDFNSQKRAQAQNAFDVNFCKLMNNSVYGKTIEQPEKRSRNIITNDKTKFQKYVGNPCYKSSYIINNHLAGVSLGYPAVLVKNPFYIGMSILELAKYHMFWFHYKVMKPKFKENLKVLYTDTDSFIYEITDDNLTKSLKELEDFFDFSNYPKTHCLFSEKNKRIPGLFKDETAGKVISEFVGLRSKMYSFILDGKECKSAKGVKKNVIKNELTHNDFKKCLFQQNQMEHSFYNISSKAHHVVTSHQSKISLSPFDDKRFLLDAVDSIPYGYYKFRE